MSPVILETYQWLLCWLMSKTLQRYDSLQQRGYDRFFALNHCQGYRAKSLSIAYAEYFMLKSFWEQCSRADDHSVQAQAVLTKLCSLFGLSRLDGHLVCLHQGEGDSCLQYFMLKSFWEQCSRADDHSVQAQAVLTKLCSLFGLSRLNGHLVCLHQGGYIDGIQSQLIQDTILSLCDQLKDEAVSLVDVVAPPDFILNSVLGNYDGEPYKHLEQLLLRSTSRIGRPDWWTELSGRFRSRL